MVKNAIVAIALAAFVCDGMKTWPAADHYHMVDPVFTPYYANGTINVDVIPAYLELTIKNGVDVILLGGSTAEWPSLTADERLALLGAWRKAIDAVPADRRPQLLFHSGDVSIAAAQHLTEQSVAYGADAVLIVAPCIMRPGTLNELVESIKAVADKAPTLPVIYYHYPELYGVNFDMDEFATSAVEKIDNFAGVKFIDPDMKTLAKATGVRDGKLFFFNNDPLLAGLAVGSKGAISFTTQFPLARSMQKAFSSGDLAGAQALQRSIFVYDGIIGKYGGKAAARALPQIFDAKIVMGLPRAPLTGLSSEDTPKLRNDLIAAGFLKQADPEIVL
jgi:N-acetylneuraminate lyase